MSELFSFLKELNQKQMELDKCLRAKRSVEDELDKVIKLHKK